MKGLQSLAPALQERKPINRVPALRNRSTLHFQIFVIPMKQHSTEEELKIAYRESGRAVAVALVGFTLQAVSVLPTFDESGAAATEGFTAFKERSVATLEELTFIAAAGIWAESLALPGEQELDMELIFGHLNVDRIDKEKLAFGLHYLADNYRTAVLAIAQCLLQQKIINGPECGQIILAHRPVPGTKRI
jgi:hypothetical protein